MGIGVGEGITGGDGVDVSYNDGERSIKIDLNSYPYLDKAKITEIKRSLLYGLLWDIVQISKKHPNENKLEFQLNNGTKREFIIVPKVSTEASFQKCTRLVLE